MSFSPQPVRSHALLIGLIRGLGALLAILAVVMLAYSLYSQAIDTLHGRMGSLGWGSVIIGTFFMIALDGFFFAIGWRIYREVNEKSVAEFSGLLALVAAFDFHYWWPLLFPQYAESKHFAFLVFIFLFRPIRNTLLRVLQLGLPSPPTAEPSNIPEFPKRSPLVEL